MQRDLTYVSEVPPDLCQVIGESHEAANMRSNLTSFFKAEQQLDDASVGRRGYSSVTWANGTTYLLVS